MDIVTKCPVCNGTGKDYSGNKCHKCRGSGRIKGASGKPA